MNEVAVAEVMKTYLHRLIRFCSDYKPDGLPDAGDLYFQEYSLQDIYMPLRITSGEVREEKAGSLDVLLNDDQLDALLVEIDASMQAFDGEGNGFFVRKEAASGGPSRDEKQKVAFGKEAEANQMGKSLAQEKETKQTEGKALRVEEESVAVSLEGLLEDIDTSLAVLETEAIRTKNPAEGQDLFELEAEALLGDLEWELDMLEAGGVNRAERETMLLAPEVEGNKHSVNTTDGNAGKDDENTRNDGKAPDADRQNPFYDDKIMNPKQVPSSRSLILAGPGFGKTTLAKRIALAYAKNDQEFLKENFLREGLIPVLLLCRSLDDRKADSFEAMMGAMLENSYFGGKGSSESIRALLVDAVKQLAREGRLLLMIDGFDEVYSADAQKEFGQALVAFLETYPHTHLILTSRKDTQAELNGGREEEEGQTEGAFLSALDPIGGLAKKEIKSLSELEITAFVHRWFKAIYPLDQSKAQDAEQIIDQIHSSQYRYLHKANMVQVPLHLTNILLLSRTTGKIPASKGELYEKYISQAINWKPAKLYEPEDLWMVVSYAALSMMKRGLASVRQSLLIEILDEALAYFEGFISWSKSTEELIFVLESVTCLIQKTATMGNEPAYQFAHNQFMEYLAACALVRGYVDGEEAYASKTNRVLAYTGKNRWTEVVSFGIRMLDDEELIGELVKRVKDKEKQGRPSRSEKNLLFEIITSFGFIVPAMRRTILDLVFKTGITEPQVRMMEDFLQDPKSQYFSRFVEKQFQDSTEAGHTEYGLVRGALEIYRQAKPVETAVKWFVHGESLTEILCGSYMLDIMAWCKAEKISKTSGQKDGQALLFDLNRDELSLGESFKDALHRRLMQTQDPSWQIYVEHLVDLMHADMLKDPETIFTQGLYGKIVALGRAQSETMLHALSVFPLNDQTLRYAEFADAAEAQSILLEGYKNLKDQPAPNERVLFFAACLMAGAWDSAPAITKAYDELKRVLDHERPTGLARYRLEVLEKEMKRLGYDREFVNALYPDPYSTQKGVKPALISEALGFYQVERFQEAKEAFLAAFHPDHFFSPANNYLAMMLRRQEIGDLNHLGYAYTVPELIGQGVEQGDVFSLINMALFQSSVYEGGDITGGDPLISLIRSEERESIEEAKRWWTHMARLNDLEGQVVVYWLLKHELIDRSSVGNLRTLEVMFHRNNIRI